MLNYKLPVKMHLTVKRLHANDLALKGEEKYELYVNAVNIA